MKNILIKALLGMLCLLPQFSLQLQSQSVDLEEFDAYIQQAVETYELPGMAISICNENEVLFKNAYGVKNQDSKQKVDTKSVFAIASLSKAFTAAALGILVDEAKIKWTDRVQKYLPDFELMDTNVSRLFTIEDLLSHRSGFITFDGDLLWYETDYDRAEILKRFKHRELTYDFRTDYGYQNIMFIAAGEIIPAVSGMSWDEFVEQRILKPLKMTSTYTSIKQFPKDINLAEPHVQGEVDVLRNYDNSGGAAALNSNVEDLTKWIQMWLNEGIVDGDTIIQPSTIQEMLNLNTVIDPSAFDRKNGIEFKGYAMGWFLMQYDGRKVAHHGGGLPGYISKIFIVPSKKLGGIVLSNGETSLPQAMMYASLDRFLDTESETDWVELYHGFSERYHKSLEDKQKKIDEERKKGTKASLKLSEYQGIYTDEMYGDAKVELINSKLHISLLPAKKSFTSEMKHWHDDSFEIKFNDRFLPRGFVNFEIEDGKVKGFTIDLPNPDFHFYKLKFKKSSSL